MRSFPELYDIAAERKGGAGALEELIPTPRSPAALKKIPDDRYLAGMSRVVFQAGFSWKVIESKWEGFEEAFDGFAPGRCAMMSDDDLDRHLKDTRIVRHAKKILSIRDNAIFVNELTKEHGSAGSYFAGVSPTEYVNLLTDLKKRAARLGGTSAQYFLRQMGVDSFVLSDHVVKALMREGVVTKKPSSQKDLSACQEAFNQWMEEGKASLTKVSRVLAFTVD